MRIKLSVLLPAFLIPVVAGALVIVTTRGPCDDGAQAQVVGVVQR